MLHSEKPSSVSAPAIAALRIDARRRWQWLAVLVVATLLLVALWRWTPLSILTSPHRIIDWAEQTTTHWWLPIVVVVAYTPASLVMFPRPLITLFAVIAFGPWLGFTYAMSGILLAALATYMGGMWMDEQTARRIAGPRFDRMLRVLRRHGLAAITALRLVPIAPFAVEGFIAGAIRIRLWHFLLGTAIGLLPGTLTTTLLGDQITHAVREPQSHNFGVIAVAVILLAALTWFVRRWFGRLEDDPR